MKLRKLARLCEHDELFEHRWEVRGRFADDAFFCPGGVFLPDDTLVVEKVEGEWPDFLVDELADLITLNGIRKYLDDLAEKP